MPKNWDEIQSKLRMSDNVILQFVFHGQGEQDTDGPVKTMHPTEPRETETSSPRLPELFMDVAFFSSKPLESRVKAQPCTLLATEHSQALHWYLERFTFGGLPSWVASPRSPHLIPPTAVEMRGNQLPIVVEQRSLQ